MSDPATRDDIFGYLTDHQDDLTDRFSLDRIAVIGSIARGDYTDLSDVDIIVQFRAGTDHIHGLKQKLRVELEDVFSRPVQIASEKFLNPFYRTQILKEAVYV
jgi:predicted nucleotidyltransferase